MTRSFFISDLHGHTDRYEKLIREIREHRPRLVFFGGDLLPHGMRRQVADDFTVDFLFARFSKLMEEMKEDYPRIFLILGNDDPRTEERKFLELAGTGVWQYLHNRKESYGMYTFYGYANVPPTPFRFKDWERYDVSRYVDPGCIPPEEGFRTMEPGTDLAFATILDELKHLAGEGSMEKSVFLFHSPPYKTHLDRAALDGMMIDHVPMDVHVGSIAIMRFIEERQPWLTMHGHIHESSRLTGQWKQTFGKTNAYTAAWDGPELALVDFDLDDPANAERRVI
ncbi:MAG: metallophosphoesterase [Bacteroidales bacterium]|jgi:Icc-related predicted phosphoesterase|nr:metallophosphoesterase [Bacteroidales bacterium]